MRYIFEIIYPLNFNHNLELCTLTLSQSLDNIHWLPGIQWVTEFLANIIMGKYEKLPVLSTTEEVM